MKKGKQKSTGPNVIPILVGRSTALNEFCNGVKRVKGKSKKIFQEGPKDEFDMLMDCLLIDF